MTDRFKDAFDWCAKVRVFAHSLLGEDCFTTPLDTIEQALTLATEAEQLRKERDELAKNLLYVADYGDVIDVKIFDKAKRIIENGNA
jgi:hypothetical protein